MFIYINLNYCVVLADASSADIFLYSAHEIFLAGSFDGSFDFFLPERRSAFSAERTALSM